MDESYNTSLQLKLEVTFQAGSKSASRRRIHPEKLWILLQRYCIFIDAEASRSRRNTLARKVILRRIFCPAFSISMVNSECYTLSESSWAAFCTDPNGTTEKYVRDAVADAQEKKNKQKQEILPNIEDTSETNNPV